MHRHSVYLLVLSVLGLVVLGLIVLSSTSPYADDGMSKLYYTQRQAIWLVLGGGLCILAALTDYRLWQRWVWLVLAVAVVLLALCYVPGIGLRINGSARWISIGIGTFQPSEFAKVAAVAFIAHWYTRWQHRAGTFLLGLVVPGAVIGVLLALIILEVDIGSTLLIGGTAALMMFIGGAGLRYLVPLACMLIGAAVAAVTLIPERMGRIMAFMNLEAHQQGAGLQQWQGLIALGSGGVDGLGLGNGRQKMLYLPYAHTDFIFPMIGEELGMRFTLAIVFIYLLIFVAGTCIAVNARDRFGMLMGFGIVMSIGLQAAVNIGVTTALLPNKGLPLPFISYGGSNLLICLLGIGILINIHRQGLPVAPSDGVKMLRARVLPRI